MEEKDIDMAIEFVKKQVKIFKEGLKLTELKALSDRTIIGCIPYAKKRIVASEIIYKTLLKEKPQKLERYADGYDEEGNLVYDMAVCPICHKEFEVEYTEHCNYCPSCGQKLDWGEVEREEN